MLSCIFPCFNRAALFEKTLQTFTEQTLPISAYEIVVVDDGSSDGLHALCDRYAVGHQLPIHYVRIDTTRLPFPVFQFNGANNPAAANNLGIRLAKGDRVVLSSPEVYHMRETNLARFAGYPLGPKQALIANVYDETLGIIGGGLAGRALHFLACYPRQFLIGLGGFEERFCGGWGWEDSEFMDRAARAGVEWVFSLEDIEGFHQSHPRVEYQGSYDAQSAYMRNEFLATEMRQAGTMVANEEHSWGSANLIVEERR